ncbi:Crp/Fnr family transcriptional regulator [Varunaivibrio sulfuroxidans]|uniref:CRP-like cAMP-binding protein n=1 Tax=Varunaivibrio sulfuroxidans TaxID=1773489 RepID=A0A4V6NYK6_9PROT|nr:Crp/Fnr family transcriptional regulator [Varunaivibrio sulfuroxidans]TCS64711.1 CRP-like cAMP-binding protein [Varunaivibrio sulfuroxidans]WES29983.1 Crp/Fnr family transcriptional regulator [Varunaivibrio sulfuroxidans]
MSASQDMPSDSDIPCGAPCLHGDIDLAAIRDAPLLRAVPDDEVNRLLARAHCRDHPAGHLVFSKGDKIDHFYLIVSGRVKLFNVTPKGKQAILKVFEAGEHIALIALFSRTAYPASCETLEPTRLMGVSYQALKQCLRDSPGIGRFLIGALVHRESEMLAQLAEIKTKTVIQQLGGFLMGLIDAADGPAEVTLPYARKELAAQLAIAPENLSRAFAKLAQYGVQAHGSRVEIADVATLRALYRDRA